MSDAPVAFYLFSSLKITVEAVNDVINKLAIYTYNLMAYCRKFKLRLLIRKRLQKVNCMIAKTRPMIVIQSNNKESFVAQFNASLLSNDFRESCRKAGELFSSQNQPRGTLWTF